MPVDGPVTVQRIDLCGVGVDLRTDSPEFARYLTEHFPASREAASAPRAADVVVSVRWTEGLRSSFEPSVVFPGWRAESRVDRHVYVAPRRVLWLRVDDAPPIAVASERAGIGRRFDVRYHFSLGREGWREVLKRARGWRRLPRLRKSRFSTLTYYSVYYPVWWHLEAEGAAHPLHAAGVAVGGRAILLGGLPGAGKSTLAAAFLGMHDAELLADNVVLHDGARIFGSFEPLLLDAGGRASLPDRRGLRALGRRHVFERDAFQAPHSTGRVPLAAAVVLARGPDTRLERLGTAECVRMFLAINEAAKEVRRYHVFAAILGLAEPEALAHVAERSARLERLLAGVACYRLQMREGAPAEAIAALGELAAPVRAAPTGEAMR